MMLSVEGDGGLSTYRSHQLEVFAGPYILFNFVLFS